jgi:hypothetical protein
MSYIPFSTSANATGTTGQPNAVILKVAASATLTRNRIITITGGDADCTLNLTSTGINSTPIGATTPSTGAFTNVSVLGGVASANTTFRNTGSGTAAGNGAEIGIETAGLNAYLWNYENGTVYIGANNATVCTISSTGLAVTGIGAFTTTSSNALTLNRSSGGSADIRFQRGGVDKGYIADNNDGITLYDAAAAARAAVTSAGLAVTGAISLSNADTLTWGGAYGVGTPAIIGSTGAGELQFRPTGSTAGTIATISSTGLAVTGVLSATSGFTLSAGNMLLPGGTTIYSATGDVYLRAGTGGMLRLGADGSNNYALLSSTGLAVTGKIDSTGSTGSTFSYTGGGGGLAMVNSTDTSGTAFVTFLRANLTTIGSITRVGTTDAVAYNATSDRRLKTNIRTLVDCGHIIDALRPVIHDWKSGAKDTYGFIAQETYKVFPQAVAPGDDGDDDDKVIKTWGMDPGKFMPIVIAELKSTRARLAALEAGRVDKDK